MAKGQQKTNKETKKPKKDTSTVKVGGADGARPVAPVTEVALKGKAKYK